MKTLENFYIVWHTFLKVKNKDKAEKILNRIAKAMSKEIKINTCKQYWKDNSLFQAKFNCVLHSADIASAILEAFELNSKIADRWNVVKPREYPNNAWQYSGSATESKIPGVELIEFYLQNFEEYNNN